MNRNLSGIQFSHIDAPGMHHMSAVDSNSGTEVGKLTWLKGQYGLRPDRPAGEILNVEVHPDYRRRGIASEMYSQGRNYDPAPTHSPERTDAGTAWADVAGGHVPKLDDGQE